MPTDFLVELLEIFNTKGVKLPVPTPSDLISIRRPLSVALGVFVHKIITTSNNNGLSQNNSHKRRVEVALLKKYVRNVAICPLPHGHRQRVILLNSTNQL